MAVFGGTLGPVQDEKDQYFRTNTKLQAGTHDAPGEKFKIDPRLKRLFRYHFGGDGWVVMPKGRAVAGSTDNGGGIENGTVYDMEGKVRRPVLTLANGGQDVVETGKTGAQHTRTANRAIGVAYGNLYEEILDGFNRMQPTIENEIYIELPYIPNKSDAEEIEWGAFYDLNPSQPVKHGDFVMSDENGRMVKADFEGVRANMTQAKTDAEAATTIDELKAATAALATAEAEYVRLSEQVLGQVWAVETNLPPEGWLKWVGWSDEQVAEDEWKNATGFGPNDIGAQGDFPGYPYEKTYRNFDPRTNKYYPQGVPGLTNGSNIEVDFNDQVIGQIQPGIKGRHDFRIMQTPIVEGSLTVTVDGTEVTPLNVDYTSGLVTLNADNEAGTAPVDVKATFKATGQIPGVPTGWDWKGSVGAVRILLQK